MDAEIVGAGIQGAALPARMDRSSEGHAGGGDDASRTLAAAWLAGSRLAHLARRVAAARSSPSVPPVLRDIIEKHCLHHPKADVALVVHAYEVANRQHAGQMRHSGDPYITHPLAVTEILAELGVDTTTIVAALLHDTVEDTGYTLEAAAADFSPEVANLVDGVTKLDKMRFGDAAEAETLRKLIVALAKDYRVLLIKIADRLHNMRTLGFKSPPKQARIARVTLEILAPLAHRLGVNVIKRELEDRAFAVLYPDEHMRIRSVVETFTAAERESSQLASVVDALASGLAEARIDARVSARTSHLFSIYKRAQERGFEARDYNDIVRVLVLVDSITDCYEALGEVHALWRPAPGRLRDFVATPKFNMYQSLHTTVMDPAGKPVDIQIRTDAMHRLAETGIIARPVGPSADGARLEGLAWLHSLLDWEGDAKDPGEFLESLSADLDSDEVLTFTPKGRVIALPARSTPVDLAYAVHTELGHRAIGARVNGRLVPLHTRLRNGDVVEILRSGLATAGPSEDWLDFVKTSKARVRIRRGLTRQRRDANTQQPDAQYPDVRYPDARYGDAPEPGMHHLDPQHPDTGADVVPDTAVDASRQPGSVVHCAPVPVLSALSAPPAPTAHSRRSRRRSRDADEAQTWAGTAAVDGRSGVPVRLARCCLPLPGDDVVGFTTTHSPAVSVHRSQCVNAASDRHRVAVTSWLPPAEGTFPAEIAVEAFDRYGLLADITEMLSDVSATVRSASSITSEDRVARARFTVEVAGPAQLDALLAAVRTVGGVYDCYRAGGTPS
ncbi:RelA/SpoT family protein [Candidatus Protofrankia californiensis]|uniref:RelA/SpoT family protein n=1 Tax=Candidatus Protofrankia californiensis TaxID=1839754 RepID=UPI00104181E5|nr:RelA/SpoT family protein [Candidatus Protofrankia californiensis]